MSAWLEIVGVTEGDIPWVEPGRTVIGPRRLLERLPPTPSPSPQGGGGPQASVAERKKAEHQHSGRIDRARQMRNGATMPERILWNIVKRMEGYHFRRQVPIGTYFADFACHHPKLVVELDGHSHEGTEAHDNRRDAFLSEAGYRVVRFWNGDVSSNPVGVYETIEAMLTELSTIEGTESSTPLPLEGRGGGGGRRTLNLIEWEPSVPAMVEQTKAHRHTPTTILASGDPLWFGIGATLLKHLDPDEVQFTPAASSFQFAAARMRWPMQHVTILSLHARPAELIHPHITPGNRILALTTDAGTAPHVARLLVERGYGRSVLTVLENLNAPNEHIVSAEAAGFQLEIGDFYVLAVDCAADPGALLLPSVPGLPDDVFVTDGQLTKREVRAITLSRLAPYPGALLWDVGAGCGSIAIEWLRAARDAQAIAFEREGERLQMIAVNADDLGVPHLKIVSGEAPDSLLGMPTPDAVFLGGDVGNETLFHSCWTALRTGGRLVANGVTLDAEQALLGRQARLGGELTRIDIASLERIGGHAALKPRMPVLNWAVTKP